VSEPTPRTDEIEVAAYEDSEYGRRIVDVADYVAMTELSQQFERTLAAQRTALLYCYEKLQPLVPFDDWIKEIGK